jgi:apolipoprotein D and lipocalin family protein
MIRNGKFILLVSQFLILMIMSSCRTEAQPLETVPFVDLDKYAGTWYEIASFPQRFQKGCHCTNATYTLHPRGYVVVENRCRKDSADGRQSYIKGKAFVEPNTGNAKLKVQFFWPFRGKYWIIDLADDYSYAVVGHPNRQYLWILSKSPQMDSETYKQILGRLREKGFDTALLQKTDQSCR